MAKRIQISKVEILNHWILTAKELEHLMKRKKFQLNPGDAYRYFKASRKVRKLQRKLKSN